MYSLPVVPLLISFCILFITPGKAQTWESPEFFVTNQPLSDVQFINDSVGWVVGGTPRESWDSESGGVILKTIDGGKHWKTVRSEMNEPLNRVHFVDRVTGWAVGESGSIYFTNDEGETWNKQESGIDEDLIGISFVDSFTGWVLSNQTILVTDNGGVTWRTHGSLSSGSMNDITFLNESKGFIVGSGGRIIKTENGGENWKYVSSGTEIHLLDIEFVDDNTGWIVGAGMTPDTSGLKNIILKTTDGGDSWTPQSIKIDLQSRIGQVTVISEDEVLVLIDDRWNPGDFLIRTVDGGENWTTDFSDFDVSINGTYFINNTGWGIGGDGTIFHTINRGSTWEKQAYSYPHISGACFIDPLNGWALGDVTVFRTKDGGQIWNEIDESGSNWLNNMQFISDEIGWVIEHHESYSGSDVLKTNNGGVDWSYMRITSEADVRFNDLQFIDENYGWVTTFKKIFRTTDGGDSWTEDSLERGGEIHFIDSLTGWIYGSEGYISKTEDGGKNWVDQQSGSSADLAELYFFNDSIGWAVGENGTILHTTDGGSSWDLQFSQVSNALQDVHFTSPDTGWVVGGNILYTTDGGRNWIKYLSDKITSAYSVHFLSKTEGWIEGTNGVSWYNSEGIPGDRPLTTQETFEYIVQYAENTSPEAVLDSSKTLENTGAVLVKECEQCFSRPIQLWRSENPIDIETRYQIAKSRSGVDTIETNYTIDITPWNIEGERLWEKQELSTSTTFQSVYFTNSQEGWAAGNYGGLFRTQDGGISWKAYEVQGDFYFTNERFSRINSLFFLDSSTGWVIGENDGELEFGYVYKTEDGGKTWLQHRSGNYYRDVQFINSDTGWVVGGYSWIDHLGTIIKTTDGGKTWIEYAPLENSQNWKDYVVHGNFYFYSVYFVSDKIGWVVGSGGAVGKSIDGGESWIRQPLFTDATLFNTYFINDSIGWIVGEGGTVLHTTNGGDTWLVQATPTTETLTGIHFTDAQTGWVVGESGTVLVTGNGGETWIKQASGTTGNLSDVFFLNDSTGWTVGSDILRYVGGSNADYQVYSQSGSSGTVRVAIVDTGVELDHYLLQNALWDNPQADDDTDCLVGDKYGYDFLFRDGQIRDVDGHGTSVGGTVVRDFPDSVGLELMSLKFYEQGRGAVFDAVCAIYYAINEGADIINLSWGFESETVPGILYDALQVAQDSGMLVVTSAGNTGQDNDAIGKYPANLELDNIIVVTADSSQYLASYASYGKVNVDVAASGSLQTTGLNGEVSTASGTSMSAPIVTRTAAVILGLYPELSYQQVRDCLFATVDTLYAPEGKGIKYGVLNHEAALACAADKVNPVNLDIDQFEIIREPSGEVHQTIQDGDTLNLFYLPDLLNIRVATPSMSGSARLSLGGPQSISLLRNSGPYLLFDDPVSELEEGQYTLEAQRYAISNAKGRAGSSSRISFTVVYQTITGLGDDELQNEVMVFPNPTTDELMVDWTEVGREEVVILLYNEQGREVKRYRSAISEQYTTLKLSKLPPGIYMLKVQLEGRAIVKKILRE